MSDWWVRGQRFTAPGNTEIIVRVGSELYLRRAGDERFRILAMVENRTQYGPGHNAGDFVFEDRITGDKGTLYCTESSCTVQYDGRQPIRYGVEGSYGDIGDPIPLHEIDRRERPASLFGIAGTPQLLYFSSWVYGSPNEMHRLFIVDLRDGSQMITELSRPRDVSLRVPELRDIAVDGHPNMRVPLPTNPGDGHWNGVTLERLELNDYDIVHDDATGALVSLTPRS